MRYKFGMWRCHFDELASTNLPASIVRCACLLTWVIVSAMEEHFKFQIQIGAGLVRIVVTTKRAISLGDSARLNRVSGAGP